MEVVYRVCYPSLPVQLKTERERCGWSQQQLAVAAGLSIGVVRKVEQGVQTVERQTVVRLSTALGVRVEQLLGEASGTPVSPSVEAKETLLTPPSLMTVVPPVAPENAATVWVAVTETYNAHKPSLWATCRSLSDKRQRSLRPLLKQFAQDGLVERLTNALLWAAADDWWSTKALDFDTLLRENRIVSWSERWESRPVVSYILSFTTWYERAKAKGIVVGSLRLGEEQWVILPDDSQRRFTEMMQAFPLIDDQE